MSRHSSPDLGLTEKNMAFARSVVLDVKRDKIMGDHYREIFGGNMNRDSYSSCASRLWRSPVIMEYVEKLREEMRERFMITVESLIEELHEIKLVALGAETPQCGAAVAADPADSATGCAVAVGARRAWLNAPGFSAARGVGAAGLGLKRARSRSACSRRSFSATTCSRVKRPPWNSCRPRRCRAWA